MKILLIDNYDSFVHNLARYLRRLGTETKVVRNDTVDVSDIRRFGPEAIVMSPGPCTPQQAGCCLDVVRELYKEIPMLGVCLGHQVIAEAFGGEITRAQEPVHGRSSMISHKGRGTFEGLPPSFVVGRYHSLVACPKTLPDCLEVTAWLPDQTIMAVQHKLHPIVGWQFHPESVLTEHGYDLLRGFLTLAAGGRSSSNVSSQENRLLSTSSEIRCAIPKQPDWFARAIEFPN